MARKLIFLDIDGTLTEPGCNIPPESARLAVREARKEGHYVFLCTGRNYDMLKPLLQYEFDGVIASSGGLIMCDGDVIFDCPMTEQQRKLVMEVLERNGIFRTIECKDGSYTDEGFKTFLRENASKDGNSELLRWREQIEQSLNIRPMSEYEGQPIYKTVFMSTDESQLAEPKKLLSKEFMFCIQDKNAQGIINGEVVNKKFDKGQAVEAVSRYLNVSLTDTFAIGDSMNDKEMLEVVGTSICMDNGSEYIKNIVDDICPSVNEDGIYHAFVKYQIIEDVLGLD